MTLAAALDVVVAVHQHFRLDDRHDVGRLAERGVAGQRVGVGLDGALLGMPSADVDHRAPLGEAGALVVILRQALGQPVEADR